MNKGKPQFGLKALLITIGCVSVALALARILPSLAITAVAAAGWFGLWVLLGFAARRLADLGRPWADVVLLIWIVPSVFLLVILGPFMVLLAFVWAYAKFNG